MPSEYDYIEQIGTTYETSDKSHVRKLNNYFHQQQVLTVFDLIKKMQPNDYNRVIDLGCSDGGWLDDFKFMKFGNGIGIGISSDRVEKAKKRGYSETYATNADPATISTQEWEQIGILHLFLQKFYFPLQIIYLKNLMI